MAAVDLAEDALTGAVGALGARCVLHWGEMGTRWGVSRTVSQLHALLFFLGRPMHAEEISLVLQVARSNVSTSIRELRTGTSSELCIGQATGATTSRPCRIPGS